MYLVWPDWLGLLRSSCSTFAGYLCQGNLLSCTFPFIHCPCACASSPFSELLCAEPSSISISSLMNVAILAFIRILIIILMLVLIHIHMLDVLACHLKQKANVDSI